MKTKIYYYTGTGNSLWAAKWLTEALKDCEIAPMARAGKHPVTCQADAIGLVFPVHIWGIPRAVLHFIEKLVIDHNPYIFAVAVNAGQVSRTLVQLRNKLRKAGLKLSGGLDLVMPSNYIPWGGPGAVAAREKRFARAKEKIQRAANLIKQREKFDIEKGPLWQRIFFSGLYHISFKQIPAMDKGFWVDEKCNHCGICKKVCPAFNIELADGKPQWQHRCEQCLSCIQWCPQHAIQFGKKTPRYERYHHPDVNISEIIAGVPES